VARYHGEERDVGNDPGVYTEHELSRGMDDAATLPSHDGSGAFGVRLEMRIKKKSSLWWAAQRGEPDQSGKVPVLVLLHPRTVSGKPGGAGSLSDRGRA